jgi:glycosyltransferase involved in cell wall biosynthesis
MIDSLETGGSERQFAAVAGSLDPESFRVRLGCIQKRGAFLEGLAEMPQFPLGKSLYGLQSMKTRYRLLRQLRKNNIAVAHAFDFYTNLTLIPAARMAGVPVVIGSQRQLGDLLTPAKARAQEMAFRFCHAVVCNSHAAANRLVEGGLSRSRVAVIGNGLPPAAFAKTAPALPRRPGLLRVGMIARMNTASKNHRCFLRAAARLQGRFPEVEFVLAGDGPLRPELEREAENLGLKGHVLFLGDCRDIPAVLASLDISVLPSASESLSNAILESMAAAVPVVATRVGGNPELVTPERGVLVPLDDAEAIADSVGRLLGDAERRAELGRNARHFAEANFTLAVMKTRYEELYRNLLGQREERPMGVRHDAANPSDDNDRMRVAIVAASLRYVGGQSVQADLLLRHWQDDPAVEAWLIPIDPRFPRLLAWADAVPGLRTLVREPLYLLALAHGLKDADIAHIFSASYWSFLIAPAPALLLARWLGKNTLIHYHSGEARDHLRRFPSTRPILENADRLIVPSQYLVDVFREFGLPAQEVPNTIDLSQFCFRERVPLRPHLICTRGFHPYYNVDVVVRAFAEVQSVLPEARLDLVGGGPLESRIRGLVQELGLSAVHFAGVVAHKDIGHCYDAADIFINASSLDNMPVSVLEAFASGTPVVTTAPESMRYLVEHEQSGLLSEPGDAHALAQNVLRILNDRELAARLAGNARQEVLRCSWPAVRQEWLNVYRSLKSGANEASPQTVDVV